MDACGHKRLIVSEKKDFFFIIWVEVKQSLVLEHPMQAASSLEGFLLLG